MVVLVTWGVNGCRCCECVTWCGSCVTCPGGATHDRAWEMCEAAGRPEIRTTGPFRMLCSLSDSSLRLGAPEWGGSRLRSLVLLGEGST